ncbi:hypothetical protein [Streptomyces hesseae]|uniref:Uncharacterized protein n=1 Tax=Streptomyces hesseae TaxID=3075519 RepID=A0ABU2SM65_9ACTN|nr:hypothetical protein [Streptomyces sp. DSM 40473]MDT0450071.1 hypothetical protein [Streptomyces sp. DSM 40473]
MTLELLILIAAFTAILSRTDTTPADRAALLTAFVNVLDLLTR